MLSSSSVNVDSHWQPNKDKTIGNKDSVQLSEYCFDVCVALETSIKGKSVDDLGEPGSMALKDLERCVDCPSSVC